MRKWVLSAVAYLLVVVGSYYAYASVVGTDSGEVDHTAGVEEHETTTEENHEDVHSEGTEEDAHGDGHSEHGTSTSGESEVIPEISEGNGEFVITLKDIQGEVVSDIEVNHEKLMHLIVVSTDLNIYKHLHPETNDPGVFKVKHGLEAGEYRVFVDIKPKDLAYEVDPISVNLGDAHGEHSHDPLQPDSSLVKKSGEHQVTLQPTSLKVNEEIQLKFDLHGEIPEQHLGALGHVVILDEKAEQYIHVHPLDGDNPIFETKFSKPGIYKIWAEFKFNGEVNVFPYVVEIK
jgi:hypothetical protein